MAEEAKVEATEVKEEAKVETPKEEVKEEAKEENLLVTQEVYLKSGIHIGTKFKTKYMAPYIYKTRPDGLSVLNLEMIDVKLREAAQFLAQYNPEDILVVSRRENGWKPLRKLGEMTGMKTIPGRYPPGILTNPQLAKFIEPKVLLIVDEWPDANAVKDARQIGIPIVALCDTNNQTNRVNVVAPCNNKGKKALGLFFYLLTREFLKCKGSIKKDEEFTPTQDDFTEQ